MIVYFSASLAAKNQYLDKYQKIISFLKSQGHQVIADHIINSSESQVRMHTREERLEFHRQLEKWIKSCDFMVAETSFPSISVGYEISLALRLSKPVLVLYSEGDPPSLLEHHQNERLDCEKYDVATVGKTITDFIDYIQGKNDTRFTFFVTPQEAAYLDDVSRTDKLPKSVYLRQLIEKDMRSRSIMI